MILPALVLWVAVSAPAAPPPDAPDLWDFQRQERQLEAKIAAWVDRVREFLLRVKLPAEEAYFMDCPQPTVSARLDCHLEHLQVIERRLAR